MAESVGLLLLVSWGLSLSVYTLQLQRSCPPLLERTDSRCPPAVTAADSRGDRRPGLSATSGARAETIARRPLPDNRVGPDASAGERERGARENVGLDWPTIAPEEAVAVALGVMVIGALVVSGAPVAIAAGAGATIWLATRTITSTLM